MGLIPSVLDREDPSNKGLAVAALIAVCVAAPLMIVVQQYLGSLREQRVEHTPIAMRASEVLEDPGISELLIVSKMLVADVRSANEAQERVNAAEAMKEIDDLAVSRVERLRAGVVAGAIEGRAAALERIGRLAGEEGISADFAGDIFWFTKIYTSGPTTISAEARTALLARHGWFAELAFTSDINGRDTVYRKLDHAFGKIGIWLLLIGLANIVAFIAGLVWAIRAWIAFKQGELTGGFDAPAVGGPVYLETTAIFIIGMMVTVTMGIAATTLEGGTSVFWLGATEVVQWMTLGAIFWPLLRGVPADAWRLDLGLHSGEGVWKEIKVGIAAYCIDGPVSLLVMIIVGVVGALAAGLPSDEAAPKGVPMFQPPFGNSWLLVVLGTLSACVWAPLAEEIIFRGALYRYLHPKLKWGGAVVVTALVFGAVHPYSLGGLFSVAIGGALYAILREWRGSLIAGMTAHALHNASLTVFGLIVMSLLGE
ncbi:MAG: CPBP family glutamic-type intramembrane protease [Phycisphaerales bacterium]